MKSVTFVNPVWIGGTQWGAISDDFVDMLFEHERGIRFKYEGTFYLVPWSNVTLAVYK